MCIGGVGVVVGVLISRVVEAGRDGNYMYSVGGTNRGGTIPFVPLQLLDEFVVPTPG